MKIPTRLHYLWSMPPLWIIQIGKDQLVFSQIIEKGIGKQEQLYLDSHTILPHKIANPSALSKGLRHFFSQKKHTRLRAWFLLPQEFYTSPLLPHELFQFLISIKNIPIIPEKVSINPFSTSTLLSQQTYDAVIKANNYMHMLTRYNQLHPGWWLIPTGLLSCLSVSSTVLYEKTSPQQANQAIQQKAHIAKKQTPQPHHKTVPPLQEASNILTTIATEIPITIVLDHFINNFPTHTKTPRTTTITGVATSLQDLISFVTTIEKKLNQQCTLSQVKELGKGNEESTKIPTYTFSLVIAA